VGDLPDVNVWLSLVFRDHPHHRAARAYWENRESRLGRVWFCRVTMLGLLRLLSQPRVMGGGALDPHQTLKIYLDLISGEGVGLHPEPAACDAALIELATADLPPRMLTDAYLASFAKAAGLRLVTFDRDFHRFAELDLLQLRL
jgi:toxin-antitoxin system PIN domain toxin